MNDIARAFAGSYAEARSKFLAAADAAGLDVHTQPHPLRGAEDEALALDAALDGAPDAPALLVLSSGCHGVEGHCGSGVQVACLGDAALRAAAHAAGVAILHLHALNPYGFSWCRRATQENVDLNRNFQDFHAPLPANPDYDAVAHWLVPETWPPSPEVQARLDRFAAEAGPERMQRAVSGGQYTHPEGLFFGGHDPTWSHVALRHALRAQARRCVRLAWIDVHTGLGAEGVGERIYAARDDAATLQRARAWWGAGLTSMYDGSSTSARLTGMTWLAAYEEAPQAEFTGLALEYGTLPLDETALALRAEQWLENHPQADEATRARIKRRLRDAFYIDTDAWKARVWAQAREVLQQTIRGLAATQAPASPALAG